MSKPIISSSVDNFLKHLFDWDADTSMLAKIVTLVIVVPLYLFFFYCVISSFGVFDNDISKYGRHASSVRPSAHAWGFVALLVTAVFTYLNFTDRWKWFRISGAAISGLILLGFAITIMVNCNFRFDQVFLLQQ